MLRVRAEPSRGREPADAAPLAALFAEARQAEWAEINADGGKFGAEIEPNSWADYTSLPCHPSDVRPALRRRCEIPAVTE